MTKWFCATSAKFSFTNHRLSIGPHSKLSWPGTYLSPCTPAAYLSELEMDEPTGSRGLVGATRR
jgi:hypothetical protein